MRREPDPADGRFTNAMQEPDRFLDQNASRTGTAAAKGSAGDHVACDPRRP